MKRLAGIAALVVMATMATADAAESFPSSSASMRCQAGTSFDPNGDGTIDPSDIFYLVAFVYGYGPTPIGNGDANGDGSVDYSDIVYLVEFLYEGGPSPHDSGARCFESNTLSSDQNALTIHRLREPAR